MTRLRYIAEIRFELDPEDYRTDPNDWDFATLQATLAAQWPDEHKAFVSYIITDPNQERR